MKMKSVYVWASDELRLKIKKIRLVNRMAYKEFVCHSIEDLVSNVLRYGHLDKEYTKVFDTKYDYSRSAVMLPEILVNQLTLISRRYNISAKCLITNAMIVYLSKFDNGFVHTTNEDQVSKIMFSVPLDIRNKIIEESNNEGVAIAKTVEKILISALISLGKDEAKELSKPNITDLDYVRMYITIDKVYRNNLEKYANRFDISINTLIRNCVMCAMGKKMKRSVKIWRE